MLVIFILSCFSFCLSLFLNMRFCLDNLFFTHSFCLISSHCLAFLFDSTSLCLSLFLNVIFCLGNLFSTHSFCLISSHCLAFLFDSTSLCLSVSKCNILPQYSFFYTFFLSYFFTLSCCSL
jgi:hypothetical protein